MQAQLVKWGNSIAVRIPKRALEEAHLSEGDSLELLVHRPGTLALKVVKKKPSLRQMVAAITPENLHRETDWGAPVGNEIW